MVAEISNAGSIKPSAGKAAAASSRSDPTAATAASSGRAGGDNVTLTDLATRLQVLAKSIEHLPQVDQARVAEFRHVLARGDYNPPAAEIAAKLEAFERDLAARESGA